MARAFELAADSSVGALDRPRDDPFEVLLEHLCRHPRVDGAAFFVSDVSGAGFRVEAGWFVTAILRDAGIALTRHPPDSRGPTLLEASLRRSRPLFLPRVEDWEAAPVLRAQLERYEPSTAAWEEVRRSSVIGCPVRTARGGTHGVLIVASLGVDHTLERGDLKMVEVLADLAALAYERSDLQLAEARRGRRELLLKRASEATASSLESSEVERHVVEQTRLVLGVDHARLSRVRTAKDRPVLAAESGAPVNSTQAGLDAVTLADVVRHRRVVRRAGGVPSAHVPVTLGPRLFGVLSAVRLTGPALRDEEVELLAAVARISAAGLANALDFERERRIATTLTRGFVPASLPDVPGYDIGLLYEPADVQPVGGDVYGVWTLPSGHVVVLVGDVAGKGVEKAGTSAMARFFIEAGSWDCDSPAEVLSRTSAMLAERLPDDAFVTAFLGFLHEDGVRYANAGHLPPVIVREDGTATSLPGRGLPLGIDATVPYAEHDLALEPGDLLLGYTDGLVEARRDGELFGPARLERVVARATAGGADPQELVQLVRDHVRDWASGLGDDVVELALRRKR